MVLQWLVPLGFVGLLGLVALTLIYLIKPKYQNKVVSSTFVWKLALNYKRRRPPIDPFRNFLVFLCQAIVLCAVAIILAQPYLFSENAINAIDEQIYVIDASASMRAETVGTQKRVSRFERAITEVRKNMDSLLFEEDGVLSIILADRDPHYLVNAASKNDYSDIVEALDGAQCSSFAGDLSGALKLAEEKLGSNPSAKIVVFTGAELMDLGEAVTVHTLSDVETEWNIAIENCTASIEENEYVFSIDIAAYGEISTRRDLYLTVKGAENGDGIRRDLPEIKIPVTFGVDTNAEDKSSHQSVRVKATDENYGGSEANLFSSFEEVLVEFRGLNDSIPDDDSVRLYGGLKDDIRVQYCSSDQNSYFFLGFSVLMNNMAKTRNIDFTQVYRKAEPPEEPERSGFDFYIFEHNIPNSVIEEGLPEDGVLILWDPDVIPQEIGLSLGDTQNFGALTHLEKTKEHPLINYIDPARLGVTSYKKVNVQDESFETLISCNGDPLLLVKNTPSEKVVVLPFSVNRSNVPYFRDFETLLYNLVNYFCPITLPKYAFTLEEEVALSCKGESLLVESESGNIQRITSFPASVKLSETGTYTFTTKFGLPGKDDEVRKVFVRLDPTQSSLFTAFDLNMNIQNGEVTGIVRRDLLVYFAAIAAAMLFIEFILQFSDIV